MKICVYAICKNEEQFVLKWYESMKEADAIYVLDTGSTDNTISLLNKCQINVKQEIISPWRFDTARNKSLELVPNDTDICVCTDLDEIFNPGWRKELEKLWTKKTNRLAYNYNWSFDEYQKPAVNFYIEKIHQRQNYTWTHPVHEILKYTGNNPEIINKTNNITLNHYPDLAKKRTAYLSLLELSVIEDPNDDRNMHYLGREYMYYGKWNKAIDTLIKHLSLKNSTWKNERSASMRYISRCYIKLNRIEEARMWLKKAIQETPNLREPYIELAFLEYNQNNFKDTSKYCYQALKINQKEKTYINEPFSWDHTIYDILSVSLFYQNKLKASLKYNQLAIQLSPNNKRLKNNQDIILNYLKQTTKIK